MQRGDRLRALAALTGDSSLKEALQILADHITYVEQRLSDLSGLALAKITRIELTEKEHYEAVRNKLHSLSNFVMSIEAHVEELAELLTDQHGSDESAANDRS